MPTSARDLESVKGRAFDVACEEIPAHVDKLKDWKHGGTEQEVRHNFGRSIGLFPVYSLKLIIKNNIFYS